jgi:hypothetical protein
MKNEIIIYQPDELSTKLEVRIEDETVWLSQAQMAELFQTTPQNITIHIRNIYQESELEEQGTCKDYLQVQKEGNRSVRRKIQLYNLDVIISIGYRVKSIRGTQFRIWANKILKDYLLKGYALNSRMNRIEDRVDCLVKKVEGIDLQINSSLPPIQGIFFEGQIFDAHVFVSGLVKSAKKSIVIIDNYIDETVFTLLAKRAKNVKATIFTSHFTKQVQLDLKKHNDQYPSIDVKTFTQSHDRFLIIDDKEVYHIGASLKDLGRKWFAFSKMEMDAKDIICKLASAKIQH